MKTSFKTIKTIVIVILITSGFALAQESSITDSNPNLPARPEKRSGESDSSYSNRLRQWEAAIKHLISEANPETSTSVSGISAGPTESDASYMNRTRAWEAEVRRLTPANSGTTVSSSGIPARPEQRAGESDASFRNRTTQWEVEVRRITSEQAAQQQKDEELQRLRQELAKLTERVSSPSSTGNSTSTGSESILIIPSGEINTEELLTINEDMSVMSRILINELYQEVTKPSDVQWIFIDGSWRPANYSSYSVARQGINTLNSMYLQGYGALFIINVNFPLSAPPETLKQPEVPNKENVDTTWEQTRQQLYVPQPPTYRGGEATPELMYNPQQLENLKTMLIKALKHASNIRALQPDESVILRIIGTGQSLKIIAAQKQENDVWLITLESEGTRYTITVTGDIDTNLKIMSAPAALIIRAKKSDIDAFAKDELDLEQFRQRMQIISFPLLQSTLPSTTTTGRTTGTRRTDTGTTTSSTSQRGRTTTAVVPKPTYETNN